MAEQVGMSMLSRALHAAEIWLAVAYVAGMMTAAIFRPERIAYPARFRISYFMFALYILIPAIGDWLVTMMALVDGGGNVFSMNQPGGLFGTGGGTGAGIIFSMSAVGAKVCLALCIICALSSFRIGGDQRD